MKVQRFTKVMNFVAYFIYLFKSTDTFEDILAFMSQEKMQAMQKPWMPIQLYYIPKLNIWLKKDKSGFSDLGAKIQMVFQFLVSHYVFCNVICLEICKLTTIKWFRIRTSVLLYSDFKSTIFKVFQIRILILILIRIRISNQQMDQFSRFCRFPQCNLL